ncbi:MAG TPA: ribosome maturation factor RimM, partial [Bacteroidia bacterium]|nr:ribosome maturation factor RimM [Bacteroidia bacterium]
MTKIPDYYQAGQIQKTHGVKGEVLVALHEPGLFVNYTFEVIFINPGGGLVPFFISSFSFNASKNILILQLEGIDDPDAASAFIHQPVFLSPDSLPKPNGTRFFIHEVIGFTVHDQKYGELGPVKEVLDLPMQQVFRILKNDREILIPAVED